MALVNCLECGQPVSDLAETCPRCGSPEPTRDAQRKRRLAKNAPMMRGRDRKIEEMQAKIRRLLAKYDYPPDYEDKAVDLALQQAELFAASEGATA